MKWLTYFLSAAIISGGFISPAFALQYEEYPSIKLRSLDKVTARTLTFDAQVGNTIKFGDIFIKIQSCRKPPPVEKNEAAAFLQIWQVDKATKESRWIFSGWMYSSSPALSGMDHSVYDVWVMDCLGKDPEAIPVPTDAKPEDALPDEGTVPENSVVQPDVAPEEQKPTEPVVNDEPLTETYPDVAPVEPQEEQRQENKESIEGIY